MIMKRIYMFGEGTKEQKNLLGGKGANLSEMKSLGVPVPAVNGSTALTMTFDSSPRRIK